MTVTLSPDSWTPAAALTGRDRRLLYEWRKMDDHLRHRRDIGYAVCERNARGLPTAYRVTYRLRSICGVQRPEEPEEPNPPVFADTFLMHIGLPDNYPSVDGLPAFRFLTRDDDGRPVPHPWHPNIRYYGEFAGRVCLNMPDTYTDLVWGVERVAHYLRYDLYHARNEAPFPEDLRVAQWVVEQGEPKGWIYFDQPDNGSPLPDAKNNAL